VHQHDRTGNFGDLGKAVELAAKQEGDREPGDDAAGQGGGAGEGAEGGQATCKKYPDV